MPLDDDLTLLNIHDLASRFRTIGRYVDRCATAAANRAAREARLEALEECKRILDAYDPATDGFRVIVGDTPFVSPEMVGEDITALKIQDLRDQLRRSLRPKPTEEEKRAQNRARVAKHRAREKRIAERLRQPRETRPIDPAPAFVPGPLTEPLLPRRAVLGPVAAAMKMIEADGTVADAAAVMAKLSGVSPALDNEAIVAEAIREVRRVRAAAEATA